MFKTEGSIKLLKELNKLNIGTKSEDKMVRNWDLWMIRAFKAEHFAEEKDFICDKVEFLR